MRIGSPKEVMPGEARVAMTPESAAQLQKLGHECFIESGAGALARFSDTDYQAAGVTVVDSAKKLFDSVDVIAKVRPPMDTEVKRMKKGQTMVGFFDPAGSQSLLELAKVRQANVIAMEMVPRISRAQKMDALSSMANTACGPYSCVPALISRGAGGVTRNTTRAAIFSNAATFARMRHPLSP